MSSVRMCDRCGVVFSENAEDWSTFQGSRTRRDSDGRRFSETIIQDACPDCTTNMYKAIEPKTQIETSKKTK